MLINVFEELKKAQNEKYAIGAFNTNNLEVTKGIVKAAKESGAPVIIQTTPSAIKYAGLRQIFSLVKNEIEETNIIGAIHLDHAKDFEMVKSAIDIGYKSVMIDGSSLSFSENVALTKKVVDYAHPKNVTVEGEIGVLGISEGGEDRESQRLSDPRETARFVEITGIDSVAVSIGNQHGAPRDEKINLDLLREIASLIEIPLVLHGSSGLGDDDIEVAIKLGVVKINVDTLIRRAFISALSQTEDSEDDYRVPLSRGIERVCDVALGRIKLFKGDR